MRPDSGTDQLTNIKGIDFQDKLVTLTSTNGPGSSPASDYPVIISKTIGIYSFFSKTDGTHFYSRYRSPAGHIDKN